MFTYNGYLKKENIITIEECEKIYNKLLSASSNADDDEKELYKELIEDIVKYVKFRIDWYSICSREERIEKDSIRTSFHDSVIRNIKILARYQSNLGKNTNWQTELGDDRRRIGDFACYIAFIYGINSR